MNGGKDCMRLCYELNLICMMIVNIHNKLQKRDGIKKTNSITQQYSHDDNWHACTICILRSGLNSVNYLVKLRLNLNGLNYDWKKLIGLFSKSKRLTLDFDMPSQVWWVLI